MGTTHADLAAALQEWEAKHFHDAAKEGWCLSHCDGSLYGPLQVQKFDNPEDFAAAHGYTPPAFEDDTYAWHVLKLGNAPRHIDAKQLLRRFNPGHMSEILTAVTC